MASNLNIGFVATAVEADGASDRAAYRALFSDCEAAAELGFQSVWMIEHHFSDYFPTPAPLSLLGAISARWPQFELGTCVLVTPWYNALRLAEDIAQLASITDAPLHLGMGRGTAKMEYDALSVEMDEAQERFSDIWEVIRTGLEGRPFRFEGRHVRMPKEVVLRPVLDPQRRKTVHFYGAIGSPGTAERMADLDLPPMCTTVGDMAAQKATLNAWSDRRRALGRADFGRRPIMINCIVADTDEEAVREAQRYIPRFMQAQVDHYEADADNWRNLSTYPAWSQIFRRMKQRCDPAAIPDWAQWQLIGSPETVARRLQAYADLGFDTFLLHTATPGVPTEARQRWLQRFAQDVRPYLGSTAAAPATSGPGEPAC